MQPTLYLDFAATTPVDPEVAQVMHNCLTTSQAYGNPSSTTHIYGWEASQQVELATTQIAQTLVAAPESLIWTSGATEAINLALLGAAQAYTHSQRRHIIAWTTEHSATLETLKELEKRGFTVTLLPVTSSGLIDLSKLEAALSEQTLLVSACWVNNENGVIQPASDIVSLAHRVGALCHLDAAQAMGKVAVNLKHINPDFASFSAHKCYGPKGVGLLYRCMRPKRQLRPLMWGGGQQRGLRPGTLPTHQIVGMAKAFELASQQFDTRFKQVQSLSEQLRQGLSHIDGVVMHAQDALTCPHIVSFHVKGVDGEALMLALRDLALSSGSACTSTSLEPSHVLLAMGLPAQQARATLRLSLSHRLCEADIEHALNILTKGIHQLRARAPA